MIPFGRIPLFSSLEDAFTWILTEIHDTTGLPWAWSIIVLTILVRLALVPLFVKQMKSSQQMQAIAPKIKALQVKHKGDRKKLQEEQMKLYQEHSVNPFGACLPLVFQMPVFFALYLVLRSFSKHPPGGQAAIDRGDFAFLGSFIPNITLRDRQGRLRRDRPHRAVRGEPGRIDAPDAEHDGSAPALHVPGAAVPLRDLRDPVPGRIDAVLDHHEPVDRRTADRPAQADAGTSRSPPPSKVQKGGSAKGGGGTSKGGGGAPKGGGGSTKGGGGSPKGGGTPKGGRRQLERPQHEAAPALADAR